MSAQSCRALGRPRLFVHWQEAAWLWHRQDDFFEVGHIVVERACLQEPVREAPPEDHLPWLQRLVLQQSLKKLVSQRSRAEDEHESLRAGLRVHHSGVTFGIECDNALKNGGFAAAREGVDDMDWGVRHGHRGQNAPLLLVNDSQSGRQAWSMLRMV